MPSLHSLLWFSCDLRCIARMIVVDRNNHRLALIRARGLVGAANIPCNLQISGSYGVQLRPDGIAFGHDHHHTAVPRPRTPACHVLDRRACRFTGLAIPAWTIKVDGANTIPIYRRVVVYKMTMTCSPFRSRNVWKHSFGPKDQLTDESHEYALRPLETAVHCPRRSRLPKRSTR
jgi:hypothetical protein